MLQYFAGERHAALLLVAGALVTFGASGALFAARWGLRSLSVTLGIFGVLMLSIGLGLYVRTGPQVAQLLAQLGSDAPRFFAAETQRMIAVQRNFIIIEYVEATIIVSCAILSIVLKHRASWVGVTLGLVLSAAFLLAFDLIAERRGATYLQALREGVASQAGGAS